MPESVVSFQSLPPEYQNVIQLAEERYQIAIAPLQELAGGWSGAIIYLVRVASTDSGKVEHLIMKLDRKRPMSSSDEISRHQEVQQKSPPEFTSQHIPDMVYDRVEAENALAIFYAIAGQSLHNFRTLSSYKRQNRLEILFAATNHTLLDEWNAGLKFEHISHPQELLKRWLGFRLDPGQKIESFLKEVCQLHPEIPGFIVQGNILPNPLRYARDPQFWGTVRPGDAIFGLQHSDLNTNNILARFSRQGEQLEGYYLIDFALFKDNLPLLYDQRYLEMSYLVHAIEQGALISGIDLIIRYSEHDILDADQTPIEMSGVNAAIRAGRRAFEAWVRENHPSLEDDLWGQYWLAGTAAGLSYCHKAGQSDEIRLAGLIYAAANLKRYFNLFNLPMPSEASQLYAEGQIGSKSGAGISLASPVGKKSHNLPAPLTNFIGRTVELSEVTELLLKPEIRLISLTGPGGTGKTRLSLEVGRALLDQFADGVYFIDLAQVSDPTLVTTTTAHTLGIREGGGRPPLENLKDFLADKKMLLIFDNFEQVTGAAEDISLLLAATPGLKALVTSRIPLHLRGEQEYPVSPLSMPKETPNSLDETLEYESVALFRQQARAVQPRFEISEQNRAEVVEICRRLDGLPLAIEIAAARIRMLKPAAILKRLDSRLNLLVGGLADLPDRQQTLRQTIDWSYQLLQPDIQDLFVRLGVFSGGFSLEAAEEVCNLSGKIDIFSGIEFLLDNSLLRQVQSVNEEPRFDMLQTIREFAIEKAEEAGVVDEVRWAHCEYFSALIADGMGEGGWAAAMWLKRCDEEHDNFRAALSWALNDPERGIMPVITIMGQLTWFWYRYGHLQEGTEWTQRALAATEEMKESPARALALVGRGYLAMWSGDLILAAKLGKEAVDICTRLGFDEGLSMAKLGYGTTLVNLGRDREAYPHLVDAVELYDEQNNTFMKGTVLVHLANVSLGLDNPSQAIKWLDMALPYMQQSGDIWGMAFLLNNYGEVARTQGEYEKAEEYYRRTEELFQQADAKGDQARLVHTFGYIALHKGNYAESRSLFLESLDDFLKLGNHRGIAECLAGLAGLAVEQSQYEWAAPLLSAAESLLKTIDGAWWPADRVEIIRAQERMQSALEDNYEALWTQGQAMKIEDAIAYAVNGV
ncbi:MAG: tetratricopeptide repeat protein [Anaerolineales bacterium]